ncbi:unnamed protein product [Dibothriocephalus latus]|uniref:Uncharacterized protein n=1 Tax=Dibothriocephalus latus TaxID=60516 RepID=A0A3P7PP04_DIBLA|nr:unnamed protein product [Dibothriocephalus latus]
MTSESFWVCKWSTKIRQTQTAQAMWIRCLQICTLYSVVSNLSFYPLFGEWLGKTELVSDSHTNLPISYGCCLIAGYYATASLGSGW